MNMANWDGDLCARILKEFHTPDGWRMGQESHAGSIFITNGSTLIYCTPDFEQSETASHVISIMAVDSDTGEDLMTDYGCDIPFDGTFEGFVAQMNVVMSVLKHVIMKPIRENRN